MFVRKIIRIGTADGVIIPKAVLKHLQVSRGDYLTIQVVDDTTLMVTKCAPLERAEIPLKNQPPFKSKAW